MVMNRKRTHCANMVRVMPKIDDGPTDGPPLRQLKTAWVTLSIAEARELLLALQFWSPPRACRGVSSRP
jgi:hypothetical protein